MEIAPFFKFYSTWDWFSNLISIIYNYFHLTFDCVKVIIFDMSFNQLFKLPTGNQEFLKKAQKEVSTGFNFSSNGLNPFWLRSNQYGIVPVSSNIGHIQGAISNEYDSTFSIKRKLWRYFVFVNDFSSKNTQFSGWPNLYIGQSKITAYRKWRIV